MTITAAHQNFIVTPEAVQTAGAISYWRLSGPVTLSALRMAWDAAGLNLDMLPNPPGVDVALGRAVHEEEGRIGRTGVKWLVRPLAHRGAWSLVEETCVDEKLTYSELLTVKSGPVFERKNAAPTDYETIVARIRANYDRRQGEIEPNDVSSWLVKIASKLQSVPLRDTGGIYFVPRKDVDIWRRVVTALQSVSAHRVFSIPALKNSEAIDAITDAITQEAETAAKVLEAELGQTGEDALGVRAMKSRQEACETLLAKISAYDELLGVQLKCRERVEMLQAALVSAVIAQA